MSPVEKSIGISTVTAGITQTLENGRINACSLATDTASGLVGASWATLGQQTTNAVGSGVLSDSICQGKTVKETLRGIPGNAYGNAAAYGLGKTGVGPIGSTISGEIVKDGLNKGLPK